MRKKKIRFVFMILMGIIISFLLDAMIIDVGVKREKQFLDVLISIVITILAWEGNLVIDDYMNKLFPWDKKPGKRVLVHLVTSLLYSALVIYLSMLAFNKYVCEFPENTKDKFISVAVIIGVLVSVIILSIEVSTQFFANWKRSLVEVEKYKAESLQAQLQNLKDQVNPHFLFNNMSVLSSLVYKDQDKAVDFINQLSKVYRYLLDTRSSELVSLRDEMTFMESYMYLLQIRFDTNLIFDVAIAENMQNRLLPPMALQVLIENAIKHNEVSQEAPLTIHIKTSGEKLEVVNNLQARPVTENSCKSGLKNIRDRYKFFTEEEVEIIETSKLFSVRIPLLKIK